MNLFKKEYSRIRFAFLGVIIAILGLVACRESEDYEYPSIIKEFGNLCAPKGREVVSHFLTDSGQLLPVISGDTLVSVNEGIDTLRRIVCSYAWHSEKAGILVYALEEVQECVPQCFLKDTLTFDPLDLQSIWFSKDRAYLNLTLLVKMQNLQHAYRVVEEGIEVDAEGKRTLFLSLSHNRNGDVEAYTQKVFLSVPLKGFQSLLQAGDIIAMRIPTTSGWRQWSREY